MRIKFFSLFLGGYFAFAQSIGGVAGIGGKAGVGGGSNPPTPLARYLLNEGGAATTALDSGSGGNNGIWAGTKTCSGSYYTTSALAPLLNAGCFGGSNNNIIIGNIAALSFARTNSFSLTSWIKTTANNLTVFSKLDSSSPFSGYETQVQPGGQFRLYLENTFSTNGIAKQTVTLVNTGAWVFTAITYDGSSTAAGVKLYVNAVPDAGTVTSDTLTGSTTNSIPAQIGARNSASAWFNGTIEDVRVYGSVLTSAQITAMYSSGPGAF